MALTPPRGRGKRPITDEATLVAAIDGVLTAHRVDGWLRVTWEKQVEQTTQYVGPSLRAANVLAGKPSSPMRSTRGCLCKMRCWALATHTALNASSTASRAGSYRPVVCQTQRANGGPHVPADARGPCVNRHGVCPETFSGDRAGHAPRFASREQAKADRHANSGADPQSVFSHLADDHQTCCWRRHAVAAHTLVSVTGRHPTTPGIGCYALRAARNSGNWNLMERMGRSMTPIS